MTQAQLIIRCQSPDSYAITFAPPEPVTSAWLATYPVRLAALDLEDLRATNERIAEALLYGATQPLVQMLVAFGRRLARCFLPEPIRQSLLQLPPDIPLLIASDAPAYPWELLHPGDDMLFLRRPVGRQRLGPARQLETAPMVPTGQREPAMLLVANALGDLEASDAEATRILQLIDALPHHMRCTAIFREQAGRSALLAELASGRYNLVHYSGHAEAGGSSVTRGLRLADGLLDGPDLAGALTGASLVFLNACISAHAAAGENHDLVGGILQAGARACIGTLWPVSDLASADLSVGFYQALLRGKTVGEALWRARRAVRATRPDDPSWAAFVLYGDPTWVPITAPADIAYLATVMLVQITRHAQPAPTGALPYDAGAWPERLEQLASIVIRYGGRLWRLGSDGLLATFGIPDPSEDQAGRSARAALELRAAAEQLAGTDIAVTIGLATGPVILYSPTVPVPGTLTVGPAVDMALQLSRQAGGGQILADRSTFRMLETTYDWAAFDPTTYRLVGVRADDPQDERASPLIGRESELDTLTTYWKRCRERSQRQVVGLVGEAGIGKTRVMRAFRLRILGESQADPQQRDSATGAALLQHRWIGVTCPSYLSAEPLSLVRALLQQGLGLPDHATPERWWQAMQPLVQHESDPVPADRSLIEQTLGLRPMPAGAYEATEAVRRAQLVMLVRALLLQDDGPLVVAIDDAYRADEASLDIVNQLMESVDQRPILWLWLYRREWLPPWANKRRSHTIDLDELDADEPVRLLANLLPAAVPEDIRAIVLKRAGGNPLYLEELARVVKETGAAANRVEGQHEPQSRLPPESASLPGTLRLTIQSRAARLSATTRTILELAAVAAGPFSAMLLAGVLAQTGDDGDLEPALRELVARDFVRFAGQDYTFYHPLIEEVIYAGLLIRQCQTWHRRIADALTGSAGSVALIAWHRWRSVTSTGPDGAMVMHAPPFGPGYLQQTVDALVDAAEASWRGYANREAARWYQAALDVLAQVPAPDSQVVAACHAGLGKALSRIGEFEPAITHLVMAYEHQIVIGMSDADRINTADLARMIGRLRMRQGNYALSIEWMERGRQLIAPSRDGGAREMLALIDVHTGSIHYLQGHLDQARDQYEAGIRLAGATGTPPTAALAEGYNGLGGVMLDQGNIDEAKVCYGQALEIWRALGDSYEVARVEDNLGNAYFSHCDWTIARGYYERSLAFWERIDERNNIPYSCLNLGGIHLCQGRWEEARACYTRALELWEAVGEQLHPALAHLNLGQLALAQADLPDARRHLTQSLAILDRQAVDYFRAETYAIFGVLHLQEDDLDGALIYGQQALVVAERLGLPLEQGIALRILGQVRHRQAAWAAAREHFSASLSLLEQALNRHELGRTWMALAALERDMGQNAAAQARLVQAVALFEALGAAPDLEQARALLGA